MSRMSNIQIVRNIMVKGRVFENHRDSSLRVSFWKPLDKKRTAKILKISNGSTTLKLKGKEIKSIVSVLKKAKELV